MKANNIIVLTLITAAMALSACSKSDNEKARELLNKAQKEYDNGAFEKSLSLVDSLRRTYPKAIEERKEALKIFQDASEKLAQKQIADTDGELQKVTTELETLQTNIENHKKNNAATAEELSRLTLLKMKKDSLQARFEAQCATVKFIRTKRKEN